MNTKSQYIQQARQLANEETKKTFSSIKEQIIANPNRIESAVGSTSSGVASEGVDTQEIKRQENIKLIELRRRLDEEIQRHRQLRQQQGEEYIKITDELMNSDKSTDHNSEIISAPSSPRKGPALPGAIKAKTGTREIGKSMKG